MTEHPVAQRSDCTAAHPAVQKKKKKGNSKKLGVVGMGGGDLWNKIQFSFIGEDEQGPTDSREEAREMKRSQVT